MHHSDIQIVKCLPNALNVNINNLVYYYRVCTALQGRAGTYLECIPEGESERAGGLINRVVARNPRAEHDHID